MKQSFALRACHNKKKYTNIDEANLAGVIQMKSFKSEPLYMYLCLNCNKWHLTKTRTKYRVV